MSLAWLFQCPSGQTWTEWEQELTQRLAQDPAATAIPDAEAEQFVPAAIMVAALSHSHAVKLWRSLGVPVARKGSKSRRRSTLLALRRWRNPQHRQFLMWMVSTCSWGRFPAPAGDPDAWTDERFTEAYEDGAPLLWLVNIRRFLGLDENLTEWLRSLDPNAEREYRVWLDIGRLTLRRVVYPEKAAEKAREKVAAAAQEALEQELRDKDRTSGALRQNLRRLEQDRSRLKKRVRRAQQEARTALNQARGEVKAARQALKEMRASHRQELAEQARRFEGQVRALQAQLAAARERFIQELKAVTAATSQDLLRGETVTIPGTDQDQEVYRLLVESLGGRLTPAWGRIQLPAPEGYASVERALRRQALQRVRILCDGLYRRRTGSWGIAVAGFQVQVGDRVIWRQGAVVCCGPLAGSLMAEYGAVAMALRWLTQVEAGPEMAVEVWSDCRALVGRLERGARVRYKRGCATLDKAVRHLLGRLQRQGCQVRVRWVPRDKVYAADRLCDLAYRKQGWYRRRVRPRAPLKEFLRHVVGWHK